MEAHVKTVREILHSGDQFLVPFFQRHYSWRKENWQRLLDDIVALTEEADETKHFLGPLVCTPFNPVPGEVTPYQLIDGQQRLATLTVALAALLRRGKPDGFDHNPVEVGFHLRTVTQGSSVLATLGFGTESRWDSWWP